MKRALYLPKGAYDQECNHMEDIVGKYTGKVIACACACACACVRACVCVCVCVCVWVRAWVRGCVGAWVVVEGRGAVYLVDIFWFVGTLVEQ